MRFSLLFFIILFATCCSYSDYDPSLEDFPSFSPTHISSDRYLFSFKDHYKVAKTVSLIGNFKKNGKPFSKIKMHDKNGDGVFRCAVSLDPGSYYYKYLINDKFLSLPESSVPLNRAINNAGQAIIPNRESPYVSQLSPQDETVVTSLTGISFQIKGNPRLLGASGPRIEINGKHIKSSYDPASGKGFAPIANPSEGQYILKITGQDDNSNDILEYHTLFFYYKAPKKQINAPALNGATAYRVLVPWFGPEEKKGKSTLKDLIKNLDYLNNGKKDNTSLGIKILLIHSLLPAADIFGRETISYDQFNYKIANSAALRKLAMMCKKRGITLLHYYNMAYTSNKHSYFQTAYGNPASKKCDWFFFNNDQMTKYIAFGDNLARPRINISNEYAANYFIQNIFSWLKTGIGGIFFENSDQLPDTWWKKLYTTIRKYRRDITLATSCYGPPAYINQLFQSKFDLVSQADYPQQLLLAFSGQPNALSKINEQFAAVIPKGGSFLRPVGNSDGLRLASQIKNPMRLKAALGFTLTSGGIPLLNWGDELGLQSTPAPLQNIPPAMGWKKLPLQKNTPYSLLNMCKRLISLRQEYPELRNDLYNGKPVLQWAENGSKKYSCFIRRISAKRFFLGVMVYSKDIKSVSPEFTKTALANGRFKGTELLTFSTKKVRTTIKKGELEDIDIKTDGRSFLLYKFDLQ